MFNLDDDKLINLLKQSLSGHSYDIAKTTSDN